MEQIEEFKRIFVSEVVANSAVDVFKRLDEVCKKVTSRAKLAKAHTVTVLLCKAINNFVAADGKGDEEGKTQAIQVISTQLVFFDSKANRLGLTKQDIFGPLMNAAAKIQR